MYKTLGIIGGVALLGAAGYAVMKQRENAKAKDELNGALLSQMRREREALECEIRIEEGIAARMQGFYRNQGFRFEDDYQSPSSNTIYGNKRVLY